MKKTYMKPVMCIVQIEHQCQILNVSGPASLGLSDNPEDVFWDNDGLDDEDVLR